MRARQRSTCSLLSHGPSQNPTGGPRRSNTVILNALSLSVLLLFLFYPCSSEKIFGEGRLWLGRASAECVAWLGSGTNSTNPTFPCRSPSRTTRTYPSRRCDPSPSRYRAPPLSPDRELPATPQPEAHLGRAGSPVTSPGRTTNLRGCHSPVSRSTSRILNPGPFPRRTTTLGSVIGAAQGGGWR